MSKDRHIIADGRKPRRLLGHQFSVDEGHVWLGWRIGVGGRICLIRPQQNGRNVGDSIGRPSDPFFRL